MDLSYDEWCAQVDALCARHLLNDWANLCGDTDVLERAFEDGWTPLRFVQWWAERYDLTWLDPGATASPVEVPSSRGSLLQALQRIKSD